MPTQLLCRLRLTSIIVYEKKRLAYTPIYVLNCVRANYHWPHCEHSDDIKQVKNIVAESVVLLCRRTPMRLRHTPTIITEKKEAHVYFVTMSRKLNLLVNSIGKPSDIGGD